jgi:hypothetical protein
MAGQTMEEQEENKPRKEHVKACGRRDHDLHSRWRFLCFQNFLAFGVC